MKVHEGKPEMNTFVMLRALRGLWFARPYRGTAPAAGGLLQIKLGQLHGAACIVAITHIDHALRAEVHAGSLPRSADVIDNNSADAP